MIFGVERLGVAEFNRRCKESVFRYKAEWQELSERIGYWLDYEHPYVTYTNEYIESVWWLLQRLHELGTGLSIDDFGTGYSSLSQLRRLPVDEVKIDKEFVFSMGTDLGDLAIVRAIIELGHSLGLRVVAEGVEKQIQAEHLHREGCPAAQGFLFGRPMPAAELQRVWGTAT